MSAQEFQTCMRIPKLCSLQGWKTTQLTLEDSSAQSSNWRAFARAGDSISWSRKRTLRRLRGKGKNCDFLLNLYTHVDIFTYVYSIYANRIPFDYVCVGRNEIDPKGPCHIYIYIYVYGLIEGKKTDRVPKTAATLSSPSARWSSGHPEQLRIFTSAHEIDQCFNILKPLGSK